MGMQWTKIRTYFSETDLNKLVVIEDDWVRALALICRIYCDKLDISGNPEAGHFVRTSERLETEEEKVTGLLHDIVEDGYVTFEDLLLLGFSTTIVETIKLLTRDKVKYPVYDDYITSILESDNELAIRVKYADMSDNASPIRISLLKEPRKSKAINKYSKQLPRLEAKLMEFDKKCYKLERKCV